MESNLGWMSLAVALVLANGFFVAAEFALIKVRGARLAQLVRERRTFAGSAQWLRDRLERSLSACQLGITLASLALGWIGEPAVARLVEPVLALSGVTRPAVIHGLSFSVGFLVITMAHLVIGEQAPKIFAIRNAEMMALFCALPLRAFYVLTFPLTRFLELSTSAILSRLGSGAGTSHEAPHDTAELRQILGRSYSGGEISKVGYRVADAALEFDELISRQIMIPRPDVVFIDIGGPRAAWFDIMKESRHTRYPVCRGSLDDCLGILHVKDLMAMDKPGAEELEAVLYHPKYVPETMRIGNLLRLFQAMRQHMTLVVDEFGAISGAVTLENVLEQVVGPMQDEFDAELPDIVPDGPGRFLMRGRTSLKRVGRALDLPDLDSQEVDSLGGLVMSRLGKIASVGDKVEVDGFRAEVLEVQRNRATRIRVILNVADEKQA